MSKIKLLSIVLVAAFMATTTQAAIIVVDGDTADTSIGLNESNAPIVAWPGGASNAIGSANHQYNKGDSVTVVVFELPDLGGEAIDTADLTFDGKRTWESVWNVDLYGTRSAASASVSVADYGYGPTPGGTLIQDNIMTPADLNNTWFSKSTDATGDAALAAWLADQYTAVGAGGFVFLRFNSDDVTPQPAGDVNTYTVAAANATTEAIPVLTITTVPEPASLSLIALGALMIARRR